MPSPQTQGWIAARDPRLRISAALLFALVTVSLDQIPATLAAFLMAAALASATRMRLKDIARRLLALEGFMLVLLMTLPFTVPGNPIIGTGTLRITDAGLHLAGLILLKANAVVLALLALVGTLEPVVFGHALARLGVPEKLVHLLLMTVRQIHLLHEEFLRLRQAMRARAFVPRSNRHTWRSYGFLIGMLLVRSLARAQRILDAMRCRCFQGQLYLLDSRVWTPRDTLAGAGFAAVLVSLPVLDRMTR
nr:cobalt ECF transporter T component CbiQ [Thiocystis violacea]